MQPLKKIVIVLILSITFSNSIYSQDTIRKAFLAIHTGGFIPSRGDFNKVYGSPAVFINGLSIGLPFTNDNIYFYAKAMFFRKTGIPIVYHYTYHDGVSSSYTTQEGKITINQWLFNLGVQKNISLKSNYELFINGGLSLTKSKEEVKDSKSTVKASGWAGYFLGVGGEKKFYSIPISVFVEYQYNIDRIIFKAFGIEYGGSNINLGVRYYFDKQSRH